MIDNNARLSVLKRAKPVISDLVLMSPEPATHPLIERAARAISDWHSESDWPLHTDQAIRAIEAIAEQLNREGYREATEFLRSAVWREPKHRTRADFDATSSL